MRKIAALIAFFLGFSLVSADCFYAHIIDPSPSELLSISKRSFFDKSKNNFTIKGISKSFIENKISVKSVIPHLIKDFSANFENANLVLSWQKRANLNGEIVTRESLINLPPVKIYQFKEDFECYWDLMGEELNKIKYNIQQHDFYYPQFSVNAPFVLGEYEYKFMCRLEGEALEIDSKLINVSDFVGYEIWYNFENDPELPYLFNKGVLPDSRYSRKYEANLNDYNKQKVILDIEGDSTLHIALFEKNQVNGNVYYVTAENYKGGNEIFIENSEIEYDDLRRIKTENSLDEVCVFSNREGEFSLIANSAFILNPLASFYSIVAKYEDERRSVSGSGFYLGVNNTCKSDQKIFLNGFYPRQKSIYGTVFNVWTKEPIQAKVLLKGKTQEKNNLLTISMDDSTDDDGFYSFDALNGVYTLSVEGDDNFTLDTDFEGMPYRDIYNGDGFTLIDYQHFDIAITPNVYGTAKPNSKVFLEDSSLHTIETTIADKDGLFYFFVPKDKLYHIRRIETELGVENVQSGTHIEAPIEKPLFLQ
jgi:hypothetical protein